MSQLNQIVNNQLPTGQIICARFGYNGKSRTVDNISYEPDTGCLVGFEMRVDGKFSYHVKRYSVGRIEGDVILVDPENRNGPVIGRP